MKHRIKDKYGYYYNLQTKEGTWNEPEEFVHNTSQLTKEQIQVPDHQPTSLPSCRLTASLDPYDCITISYQYHLFFRIVKMFLSCPSGIRMCFYCLWRYAWHLSQQSLVIGRFTVYPHSLNLLSSVTSEPTPRALWDA